MTPPKSHGKLRLKLASCNHWSRGFELGRSYRVGKPGEPGTEHRRMAASPEPMVSEALGAQIFELTHYRSTGFQQIVKAFLP